MPGESLFSASWYRVADLKPRLRRHARVHRHHYRSQLWYVLQDTVSGRSHRFSPAAHTIIALMNGSRTVDAIWSDASALLGDEVPTQDETIRLLSQLHCADLMQCNVPPDSNELFQRYQDNESRDRRRRIGNPLALRFSLFDPDRFLERALPIVSPLFSRTAMTIWLLVVLTALVLAATHWPELRAQAANHAFDSKKLLLLWLTYTLIKVLHEFAHAFAVKYWGGEVHDMGITLLVLMPLPYVDASFASAFRDKRRRVFVGAAGVLVELFIAALALFFWLNAQPGVARTLAFDVMLIGSVSTFFFNGNPLLRFDGYYVLSDAIGIPNLASRANRYIGYLCQRYLFGMRNAVSAATVAGERLWFVTYGIASFVYRIALTCVIAIFVAGKFFLVGVLLAIWALMALLVMPAARYVSHLLTSPQIAPRRGRAVATTGALCAIALALVFAMPFPLSTRAQGVVWLPEKARVRAGADCFVIELLVPLNTTVEVGDGLLACDDPQLPARIQMLESQLEELEGRRAGVAISNQVLADVVREDIASVQARLDGAREDADALTIRSSAAGAFVAARLEDLPGRFVRKGELLGFVVDSNAAMVHVVVPQTDIGRVRQGTRGLELRLAHRSNDAFAASIARAVPAGTHSLPSLALGTMGGGDIVVDPGDSTGLTSLEQVFRYEIDMPASAPRAFPGERVFARFDHGKEPLARRWYRSVRNLFLGRFNV